MICPGLSLGSEWKAHVLSDQIQEPRFIEHIKKIDLILFLLEAPQATSLDIEILNLLRKKYSHIPFIPIINKIDLVKDLADLYADFFSLSLKDPFFISVYQRTNLKEMIATIEAELYRLKPSVYGPLPKETAKKKNIKNKKI